MNSTVNGPNAYRRNENGAAMVIALVMLVVLTLLATASARMTLMEERMTGNTQERNVAFQAAEAGLRAGERAAQIPVLPDFTIDAFGLYTPVAPGFADVWETVDWGDPGDVLPLPVPGGAEVSFVMEELPRVATPGETLAVDTTVDDPAFFRITSRGVGVAGNATVTLQTTFRR